MLGRLTLATHWGMYFILLLSWITLIGDYRTYDVKIDDITIHVTVSVIPFGIFTLIYWIVKKRWVLFPWQHVKPEE